MAHIQLRWMKDVLQLLDAIEIHAIDFDCYADSGSDGHTATDVEVPIEPETTLSSNFESSEYRLASPHSDRLATVHVPPIPFDIHWTTNRLSKVHDTTEHPGLDWQMEEDWRDNCQADKQHTDR